jgi:hypothetical protein
MYAFHMVLDQLTIRQIEDLDDGEVDPKELSSAVDRLQLKLCRVVNHSRQNGDHLLTAMSPVGWVAETCAMSRNSASDRLCVGEQIASLPIVAQGWAPVRSAISRRR